MRKNSGLNQILLAGVLVFSVNSGYAEEHGSYQRNVAQKAGNGLANLTTGALEIPKNIINISNSSNIVYGVFGGMLKGTINMVGRMGVGLVDLVTAPIPTQPIVQPLLIWDDFDTDTHYGAAFREPRE
jgi:putative exosortase-associated protein (TIGR04073 family)